MDSKYSVVINGRISDAHLALLEGRLRMQAAEVYRPFLDSAPVIAEGGTAMKYAEVKAAHQGIRVYKYCLGPPIENANLVLEQFDIAREYRRALFRTERSRRLIRLAVLEWSPAFREARELAIQARARADESRDESDKEADRAATKAFMNEYHRILRVYSSLFRRIDDGVNEEQAMLREEYGQKGRGLFWGTYNLVAQATQKAAADTPEFGRKKHGVYVPGPDHHWPKAGDEDAQSLDVQIQKGLPVGEVFGESKWVQIVPWTPPIPTPRGERVAAHRAANAARRAAARDGKPAVRSLRRESARRWTLRLRIGSSGFGNREPIWATFPLVMHRPLPADGVITHATASLRRFGSIAEWSCQITVNTATVRDGLQCGNGVAAVALDWAEDRNALIVARWSDGGAERTLRLVPKILGRMRKCDDLRSVRDKKRDEFLPRLHQALTEIDLPAWLRLRAATLQRWESCNRIHSLLREWTDRGRFAGDKRAYTMLAGFCYRDQHLWDWEACQRKKVLRRRRELYRRFAAWLAKRYETLVVESTNLSRVALKKGRREADDSDGHPRVLACPSELRDCLIKAFGTHGGKAFSVAPSKDKTATGLLANYRERPSDAKTAGGPRRDKKTGEVVEMAGGRFRRAKAAKAKKALENDTARDPSDKAAE